MKPRTIAAAAVCTLAVFAAGCATYEPAPIAPLEILEGLESRTWPPSGLDSPPGATDEAAQAVGPAILAAFAVTTNPELASARAELGLQEALLVQAGLLPDPRFGWDAMDLLASELVEGSSSTVDFVAGLGLMFPIPRPRERDARVQVAEWQTEASRRSITAAEWDLTRKVHIAFEEARAAEALLSQTNSLVELAESTHRYFERARDAGAVTAIQENLALGELHSIRLDVLRAEARRTRARHALNALLALPPATQVRLGPGPAPSRHPALENPLPDLTKHAIERRPDLAVLLADYRAADEAVRLALTQRFPALSIGTGIELTLPIFSRFGRPEVQTAIARRTRLELEFIDAVHQARREVAASHANWTLAERELALVEEQLLPNAEANLELSREAFQAGEVTLFETLALQSALVDARTRYAEAQADSAKQAWSLLAATGWLLETTPAPSQPNTHTPTEPR